MLWLYRIFFVGCMVLCFGSACGGGASPTLDVQLSSTDVTAGGKVTLTLTVGNFKLTDPKSGTSSDPTVGYYRIYLDEKTGSDFLVEGYTPTLEITLPSALTSGDHTLRVQLMKSNQTPIEPTIDKKVTIKVGTANISVKATPDKTQVKAGEQITLTVKVTGFNLVPPASNTVNKKGEGHYHVSFDNDDPEQVYASVSHEETVKVTIPLSITAGSHKMHVYLMNNNHSKYSPEAKATLDFEVTQAAPPTLQISLNKQTAAPGDTLILKLFVTNFALTKIVDNPQKKPGTGHYHVLVNDGNPEDSSKYIAADHRDTLELVLPSTTPTGKQNIVVYLMNNDHTKYTPETKASVPIEVVGKDQPIVNMTLASQDIVADEEFEISISVGNFKLTPISNTPVNKSGEGHYHVVLDDADPEKDYLATDYKDKVKVKFPANIAPGVHKLHIYLMNNDHTRYKPEAKATLDINVIDPKAPRVSLSVNKTSVKAGDKMEAKVEVKNFTLVAISGAANKANEGHFHLAFDSNDPEQTYVAATHESPVTISIPSNLAVGKHRLYVYLMNNDHSKYKPEAKAFVEFEITP